MSNPYKADVDILTANDDGRALSPRHLLCVHTFEDGGTRTAEDMAKYQAHPSAGGSYHIVIDRTGRSARENDDAYIPWSAMYTGNRKAFHFSLSGRAAWTRDQWMARSPQLETLAKILATYSRAYGIPLVRRNAAELRSGKWGVCGHADISAAWRESDHTDPGAGFPFDYVIGRAVELSKSPDKKPSPKTEAKPMGTTLDSSFRSLVPNSTFEASLATYIRLIDKHTYEANQRLARLENAVKQLGKE